MFKSIYVKITVATLILFFSFFGMCGIVLSSVPKNLFLNQVSWAPIPNYGYELSFVKNSKNQNQSLWYFGNTQSKEVILYLHGSAGRIGDFFPELTKYANVLSPAYSGYSESDGDPTPENVLETAKISYDWLIQKGYKPEQITILGHSMGGSPATHLASNVPAKRLILINTFSSFQSMCFRQLAIFCAFTGDIFNTSEYAKNVKIPVRQYAYKGDTTVPFDEGKLLYSSFTNTKDKMFLEIQGHTHAYPIWSEIAKELPKN